MTYFKNPEQAVDAISTMLSSEAWEKLSRYYDLSDTDIDRASLISGEFFVRKERPELAHPAGFWRIKEPFSPQYAYQSHYHRSDEIVDVTVHIEIDEGMGMIRKGRQTFQLRKSPDGYQLLPRSVAPPPPVELPEFVQPSVKPIWEKE